MHPTRRIALAALGATALTPLSGCGTLIPSRYPEAQAGRAPGSDEVLLVGRIELVPRLRPDEQKLRVGTFDPADMRGQLHQRAVLFLGNTSTGERENTGHYINPPLEEWFAFVIKREHRHITDALVYMEYEPLLYGRRQAVVNTAQLQLPAPLSLDLRPEDRAVYVGTWRLWRDEFHQVTRATVVNDLAGARGPGAPAGQRCGPAHTAAARLERAGPLSTALAEPKAKSHHLAVMAFCV